MNNLIRKWNGKYKLAKNYYEYYGNINMKADFKTKDGRTFDIGGIYLYQWIYRQIKALDNNELNEEQVKKLKDIGVFASSVNKEKIEWEEWYNLAEDLDKTIIRGR